MKKLILLLLCAVSIKAASPSFNSFNTNDFTVTPSIGFPETVSLAGQNSIAPLNVKRYGAAGDGVTDDYTAIQSAIDAVSTGATTNALYFPPGQYVISQGLSVTEPITLYGDNMTGKFDNTGIVVGAQIVYTGTNIALNCQTYRVNIRNLRLTSTANAYIGLKMKGEESYISGLNVGTTPGQGFQIGIYAENASISTFRDCILSCNTVAGMMLDTITGACSSIELDRMHFYRSPIGLHLTVSSDIRLTGAWFEACQKGIYVNNDSAQNMILQNVTITGNHYLNNPAVSPFYTDANFITITNSNSTNSMEIRGLKVSENHVLNLSSPYDIAAYFGGITPVVARVMIEDNNFWGSTAAVFYTDSTTFRPVIANNSIATAAKVTEFPGETAVAPFQLQGSSPSLMVGEEGKETALRLVAGKQPAWSAYIQVGTNELDTAAQLTINRLNTGTNRISLLSTYADLLNHHGEFILFDPTDAAAVRLLPNASGTTYFQLGANSADTNDVLQFSVRDTATNQYAMTRFYSKEFQIWADTTRISGATLFGSYARLPFDTWLYGLSSGGLTNVALIGNNSANQIHLAPSGNTTLIGGSCVVTGTINIGGAAGPIWAFGTGTPLGALAAPIGSIFSRTDGGAGTTLYVKEAAVDSSGWVAK